MIVLQSLMPDKCKRCKESGGLEDVLHLINTDGDYVDFFCDGQSPKTCPIKGEIPDEHGRLIDADMLKETLMKSAYPEQREWYFAEACQFVDEVPTVLEASK